MKLMKITAVTALTAILSLPALANPRSDYGKPGKTIDEMTENRQGTSEWPRMVRGTDLMGATVRNTSGEELGTIEDLLLDSRGRTIDRVVVATGGVLGINEEHRAVSWGSLQFENQAREGVDAQARLDLTVDEFKQQETFESDDRVRNPDQRRLSKLMGRDVKNAHGEHVGEIHDVTLDARPGRLEFALVDLDEGLLDLDADLAAVAWTEVDVSEQEAVRVSLTRKQMEQATFDGDLAVLAAKLEDRPVRYGAMGEGMMSIDGELTKVSTHDCDGMQHVILKVKTDEGRTMKVDGGKESASKSLQLEKGDQVSITGAKPHEGKEGCDLKAHSISSGGKTVEVGSRAEMKHHGSRKHENRY